MKTGLSTQIQLDDKYIIPNASFGITDSGAEGPGSNDATSYNIRLKSNYLTTLKDLKTNKLRVSLQGLRINTIKINQAAGSSESIDTGPGTLTLPSQELSAMEGTGPTSRFILGLLFKPK